MSHKQSQGTIFWVTTALRCQSGGTLESFFIFFLKKIISERMNRKRVEVYSILEHRLSHDINLTRLQLRVEILDCILWGSWGGVVVLGANFLASQ